MMAKEIVIPFQGQFRNKMLRGSKYSTWRRSRKGEIGDTFWAFGKEFEIQNVEPMTQGEAVSDQEVVWSEGFDYGWELKDIFDKLYRRAGGYDPDKTGFLHTFKLKSSHDGHPNTDNRRD